MLKKSLLFALCILFTKISYSQDIITLKNGEEIKSKVVNIGQKDITYKKFENQEGPSYTMQKSEVFFVKYENGTKEMFNENNPIANKQTIVVENMEVEGTKDAALHYPAKFTGAGWTLANSILLTPLGGLLTAALCAGAKPQNGNLGAPYKEKMENNSYLSAYKNEASKMKKKKIWTHLGIGSAAWLALTLLGNSNINF